MVLFNYSTKELTAKVVYYGPGLCGKTTNLQWIHEKLPIKNKGKMLSLATETDRTLFFDFLPIELGTIRGMKTRIQLYTVPGQVFYNQTRRMVLKGADAVVFVCDSQAATLEANIESFENLRQNLVANEIDPDEIPVVLQYNKRDLPSALPIEILNEKLNQRGYPWQEAVAMDGRGVEDTLKLVTKHVFKALSTRYNDPGSQPLRTGSLGRPPRHVPQSAAPVAPAPVATPPAVAAPASASSPPPAPVVAAAAQVAGRPAAVAVESLPPLELEFPPEPTPVRLRRSADVPTRPPVLPTPPPPPSPEQQPLSTIVTKRDEADELRRRIANPGIPEDEEELDLEELEPEPEVASVPPLPLGSVSPLAPKLEETRPQTPAPTFIDAEIAEPRPAPAWQPEATGRALVTEFDATADVDGGESEVEVPIELELQPGTTRLNLRLKITLRFRD